MDLDDEPFLLKKYFGNQIEYLLKYKMKYIDRGEKNEVIKNYHEYKDQRANGDEDFFIHFYKFSWYINMGSKP